MTNRYQEQLQLFMDAKYDRDTPKNLALKVEAIYKGSDLAEPDLEPLHSPANPQSSGSQDSIDSILTKAFNDFYDYITERDIIKAAHEYSEKTVYKQAKSDLLAWHNTQLKAAIPEKKDMARYEELNDTDGDKGLEVIVDENNESLTGNNLAHLAQYAEDRGFNQAISEMQANLEKL